MSGRKMDVLRLYKSLLRESQKFPSYNYRNYFLRRIKDAFRENKGLSDADLIRKEVTRAASDLNIIKRQVIVGRLYQTHKLVIEQEPAAKTN